MTMINKDLAAYLAEQKSDSRFNNDALETILNLYAQLEELEEVIEKADRDQCGCLGGSCRIP